MEKVLELLLENKSSCIKHYPAMLYCTTKSCGYLGFISFMQIWCTELTAPLCPHELLYINSISLVSGIFVKKEVRELPSPPLFTPLPFTASDSEPENFFLNIKCS
jgi:hypothetical protein